MKLCFVFKEDMEVIWYFTRDMKSIKMGERNTVLKQKISILSVSIIQFFNNFAKILYIAEREQQRVVSCRNGMVSEIKLFVQRSLSYGIQPIHSHSKPMDWFLYDRISIIKK